MWEKLREIYPGQMQTDQVLVECGASDEVERTTVCWFDSPVFKGKFLRTAVLTALVRMVCMVADGTNLAKKVNPPVVALLRKWISSIRRRPNRKFSDALIPALNSLLPNFFHNAAEFQVCSNLFLN